MKAWTVLAIVKDGELICHECLQGKDENEAFHDKGDHPDIGVLFASNAEGDETCTRCNQSLTD